MPELYVYHLSADELNLSRFDVSEAVDTFGLDTVEFCECMLARQKAWANLIATDYPRAVEIKIDGGKPPMPYETQASAHEGAVNAIIMRQNRLKHAIELREHKKTKKERKSEV